MHKLRRVWLVFGWLWIAVVMYLSLIPNPPEPMRFPNADKLEHAFAYALLMLWFAQVYVRRTRRLFTAVLLVAMGIVVEFLQDMSGYRTFEFADIVADLTGVLLGWVWARTGLGHIGHELEKRFIR